MAAAPVRVVDAEGDGAVLQAVEVEASAAAGMTLGQLMGRQRV